ncbi:MAG: hypothetical protein AAF569_08660 [Pseudomonadota bacterium]
MDRLQNNIDVLIQTRRHASNAISDILKTANGLNEKQFADALNTKLTSNPNLLPCGWYNPPPFGISVLAEEKNNLNRLLFDSLRKEEFWPSDYPITKDSILFIYCSPVDKNTAVFGDIGVTVYAGEDTLIINHLQKAFNVLKQVADYCEVGMEFRDICDYAQKVFKENNVNNDRALLLTSGKDEFNLGHTVPFTHELPSKDEQNIINSGQFEAIRDLISHKRIYVGPEESFKITDNCAFTIEARLEDNDNSNCPNNFYHLIVSFKDGKKEVHDMYEPIKKAWNAKNL